MLFWCLNLNKIKLVNIIYSSFITFEGFEQTVYGLSICYLYLLKGVIEVGFTL